MVPANPHTVEFAQLLAKIAHGFAVGELGYGAFKPLLSNLITRRFRRDEQFPECIDLVGGEPALFAADNELHVLGYDLVEISGRCHMVVSIRLFANLGSPIYRVVVGEIAAA